MDFQNRKAAAMVSAMNYKSYSKGALVGFFDLRYHGMSVKGCRLMNGGWRLWKKSHKRRIKSLRARVGVAAGGG